VEVTLGKQENIIIVTSGWNRDALQCMATTFNFGWAVSPQHSGLYITVFHVTLIEKDGFLQLEFRTTNPLEKWRSSNVWAQR
jgi:hypothetical protein